MSSENHKSNVTITFKNGAENPIPKLTATFPNGREISIIGSGAVMLKPVFEAMAADVNTSDNEFIILQIHSSPPSHLQQHMRGHRHEKNLKTAGIKFDPFD